ncbi:MAG TPA: hypothetical protein VNO70_23335 [Blastocatellia bacterium]|nr:hypothetical protein [Blastocatellia bacterium]
MIAEVLKICEAARAAGGRALLVGGSVRDMLLGIEHKDFDLEVYGIEPERLRRVLQEIAPVNTVGEHFAVYKLTFQISDPKSKISERFEVDVSVPRRESKSGRGHRGFVVTGDPAMTFEEAARRRDFTVNAILYDPLTDEYIDPFGGIADLKRRVLRAVAADTFIEDSLRVLRAVQFAARFEMTIEAGTVELCRTIDLSDLPHERIWGEVEKLLTRAERPSIGLEAARELGVLGKLFPALAALSEDDFTRTKRSLDEAVKLAADLPKPRRIAVMLATLFQRLDNGQATAILDTLGLYTIAGYDVRAVAIALAREHLKPEQFYQERDRTTDGDFRRLAQQVELDLLYRVAKACMLGRGSSAIAADWFIARARSLGVEHEAPAPILMGRHLLEAGFAPGPRMGEILKEVYEMQLDDKVTSLEEALVAARDLQNRKSGI